MEVKKESLRISDVLGTNKGRTTAEADIIVPDTKPDAVKVAESYATCVITDCEVQSERVLVYGSVDFNVVYLSEDNEAKGVAAKSTFTDVIDVPGAAPGMRCDVQCAADRVEYRLLNGRKITVKAVIDLNASVMKESEIEAVSDLEGDEIEKQFKTVRYMKNCGTFRKLFSINEKVEIAREQPAVQEILRMDGKISNKSVKVINNKVIVKADADVVILYVDDAEFKPCSVSLSVPFTEILDIDGVTEDWFLTNNIEVCGFKHSLEADEDGKARLVDLEITAEWRADAFEPCTKTLLSDCYGITHKTKTVCAIADLQENAGEIYVQTGVKGRLDLSGAPAVEKVYDVVSTARVDSISKSESSVTVKGTADVYFMYITADDTQPVYSIKQEIPFEETVASSAGNGAEAYVNASVTGMSYTLNGDSTADIRGNIELKGLLLQKKEEKVITEAELTEEKNALKAASLTVCFAQENDTLWDVAKRYSTSVAAIMEVNGLPESTRIAGKRLIVPKYR